MFNDRFLLTQAVLEDRKTQTRRIIKYPREVRGMDVGYYHYDRRNCNIELMDEDEFSFTPERYIIPTYEVGEIVAIAQSYKNAGIDPYYKIYNERTKEYDNACDTAGWTNKMYVKAELMPTRIEITNNRLQRLQDITDDECLLEGIEKEERTDGEYNYTFFDAKRERYIRERTTRDAYVRLIDANSGTGTWYSNPYVFAYDFELVK